MILGFPPAAVFALIATSSILLISVPIIFASTDLVKCFIFRYIMD